MSSKYKIWQLNYYKHIKDIRNILLKYMPKNRNEYLNSDIFFEKLSLYIYNNSSKKIDKYLEPLSDFEEQEYYEYLVKNNIINNKNE